jgi:sarcosine oxidase subunit beta
LFDVPRSGLRVFAAPEAVGGLVIAAGFSGHGFCLGPISGEICAALALGQPPRHDLAAFRLARFAEGGVTQAELSLHG